MREEPKKPAEKILYWLPAIGFLSLLLFFEVRRKGLFLTYLQLHGFLLFALSIVLTYAAYRLVSRTYHSLRSRYPRLDVLALLRVPAIFLGFFFIYFSIQNGERALLLSYSGVAEHILYPCSHVLTDEMKQEALNFWRMRPFDEFDCEFESSESKW
jgi:hypothetical protein